MTKNILLIATLLFSGVLYLHRKPRNIVGIWWNEEKDGRVEVYQKGDEFYGKVEYVKKNVNPDGSQFQKGSEESGSCQEKASSGLCHPQGLKWTGDEWEGGEIYDTKIPTAALRE